MPKKHILTGDNLLPFNAAIANQGTWITFKEACEVWGVKETKMGIIKKLLGDLIESKKFRTFIIGALAGLAAKLGLPEEHAMTVAGAVWGLAGTFIIGQGVADIGKEKAKVEGGK